jgi:hypothetical protein
MRKILSVFFLAFLLGNNVVWALDSMDLGQEHEKQSHSTQATNQSHNQDQETDSCDHCCHGSAHLLGLLSGNSYTVKVSGSSSTTAGVNTLASREHQPPLPPPNA